MLEFIRKLNKVSQKVGNDYYPVTKITVPNVIDLSGKTFVRWILFPTGIVILQFSQDQIFSDLPNLLSGSEDVSEYKQGFDELFRFFLWVRDNATALMKESGMKMYNEKIDTLNLGLLNQLRQREGAQA